MLGGLLLALAAADGDADTDVDVTGAAGPAAPAAGEACPQVTRAHYDMPCRTATQGTAAAATRSRLADWGIRPHAVYIANIQTNTGGERQDWAYAHYAAASLTVDLGTLAGLGGLSLMAEGNWSAGRNLSADIGNAFQVGHAFSGDQVALARLYLQQRLFNGGLAIAVGRLNLEETFATTPLFADYLSSAINMRPGGLSINDNIFGGLPNVQWGVQAIGRPTADLTVGGGVFNTNRNAQAAADHGLDLSFDPGDGVLAVGEVGYAFDLGAATGAGSRPGEFKAGGFHDSRRFDRLDQPDASERGLYAFYAILRQTVWRPAGNGGAETPGDGRGVTPWAAVTWAPKQRVSRMPVYLGGGVVWQGPLQGRGDDRVAAAVYHGRFSRDIDGRGAETVIEVNYTLQLTPWFHVTPDIQYVINPAGRSDIDNAAVFGGEIGIVF